MRVFARGVVVDTAGVAGIVAANVIDKPNKQSKLLPLPRLEFESLDEQLVDDWRLFAKLPSKTSGMITHRKRTHLQTLSVRAVLRAKGDTAIEQLYRGFVTSLPRAVVDGDGNRVAVKAQKAVRGGFVSKIVAVSEERSVVVYITFIGGLYKDEDVPLIDDFNLVDGITHQ